MSSGMFSRTCISRPLASSSKTKLRNSPSRTGLTVRQRDLHVQFQAGRLRSATRCPSQATSPAIAATSTLQARCRSSRPDENTEQSIFNTPISPWEQLFAGSNIPTTQKPASQSTPSTKPHRRVEMTAQEQKTFTDLFDEIFRIAKSTDPQASASGEDAEDAAPAFSNEFYERIRHTPRKPKWSRDMNEELDKKKEEIDLCQTDQELLEWMLSDVFGESQRYEAEARELGTQTKTKRVVTLQPAWYPYIIAHLMRIFRDKYQNPHTALSIFNYAKTVSIASYAFGCSTDSYNELIETHWSCFRDIEAVLSAFKEMNVGGVAMNYRTGQLLDNIRRDIGLSQQWSDDEVSNIITRLDAARRSAEGFQNASKRFKGRQQWDQWKNQALQDDPDDQWGFNNWDTSPAPHRSMARSQGVYLS